MSKKEFKHDHVPIGQILMILDMGTKAEVRRVQEIFRAKKPHLKNTLRKMIDNGWTVVVDELCDNFDKTKGCLGHPEIIYPDGENLDRPERKLLNLIKKK